MEDQGKQRELLITLAGVLLASVVFILIRNTAGDYAAIVSALPIALIAYFFGTRPGLLAATVAFPLNTFVLDLFLDDESKGLSTVSAITSLSLVAVGWLFGRFHKLHQSMEDQEKEHRRAQTALATSEERMRGFLSASPDIIFRVGPSGRLLEIHGEQRLGLSLTRDQYLFRPLNEVIPPEAAAAILTGSAQARANGSALTMFEAELPEGVRSFQISLAPGGGSDVVGIARDVTEFLETEEHRRALEMIRAKDEFVAEVVQELRTPLAGILELAKALHDSPESLKQSEAIELVNLIATQSRRISHRIDDLLVAARADLGHLVIESSELDLADAVHRVVRDLDETVSIEMDRLRVLADGARLNHILRNLIGNAVEHGGTEITITGSRKGEMIVTRVTDNGQGFGEHPENIFTHHPTSNENQLEKIGVGLSVAKQLANLMRGDVTHERTNNLTVFELSLPAA